MAVNILGTARSQMIATVDDAIDDLTAKHFYYIIQKTGDLSDVNDFRYRLLISDADDASNWILVKECGTYSTAQRIADKHLSANRNSPPSIEWSDENGKRVAVL